MEVTLRDIAQEVNVSAQTVSRSLRNDRAINPETRARVNEAARRLGYKTRVRRPRSPKEQDNNKRVLGLLMRHSSLSSAAQSDANLMKMMAGLMSVADEQGLTLKVHPWQSQYVGHLEEDSSLLPPMLQDGTCQALIVHGDQDERDLASLSHRVPVVSMGRTYDDLAIDAAVAGNAEGVRAIVTHLVELGHRRLAWIGTPYSATFMQEREAGFIQGCRKHGLELGPKSFFVSTKYSALESHHESRIDDQKALLALVNEGTTAFVCGNDGQAVYTVDVLQSAGLHVPGDVSVTGFDAALPPNTRPITTIDPHFFEIGQVAARLALQRVSQHLAQPCIVSVRGSLVQGESTAPPR